MRIVRGVAVLLVGLVGCKENGTTPPMTGENFNASLSAAAVTVPVTSTGTGAANLTYDAGTLAYTIDVAGMNAVTMAHIHGPATAAQDAAIIVTLFAPDVATGAVTGRLANGTVAAGSELLTPGWTLEQVLGLMRAGQAYVLVHTTQYPDGEIRGQVTGP